MSNKSNAKKALQLGMNPSTANSRLNRDILFMLVIASGHKCYRCGGELTRETFTIEHKEHWLDSEDPKAKFFDLANIAFSHHSCNSGASRQPSKRPLVHGTSQGYDNHKCRCEPCKKAKSHRNKTTWNTPEKRKLRYKNTGQ